MGELLGMIVFGGVIGVIAKFLRKGDEQISPMWTIALGVVGAFLGGWIAGILGVAETPGIDWIRWIASVVCAMGAISVYLGLRRSK